MSGAQRPYVEVEQLDCGVTLIQAPIVGNDMAGIYLIVKAGSRDETAKTAGLAHFLEHMFFKGTESMPSAEQIGRELALLGAEPNAFTGVEEVCYHATGPAHNTQKMAEIICEMVAQPLFLEEEFERERNVVAQELASVSMEPREWLEDNRNRVAFGGRQAISWSPAGFPKVIREVSREELLRYRGRFYATSSMALVVCGGGNVEKAKLDAILRIIPRESVMPPRSMPVWGRGKPAVFKRIRSAKGEERQVHTRLVVPGVAVSADNLVSMEVAATILGGDAWSRLFLAVREREGLCYYIRAEHEAYDDCGVFEVGMATSPQDAERAMELTVEEIRRTAEQGPTKVEMAMARATLGTKVMKELETAEGRGEEIALRWSAGLPLLTAQEQADGVERVTAAEVQACMQMIYSNLSQRRVAMVGAEDRSEGVLAVTAG